MNTASEMYIAFLHRLRHQKTTTATPDEFNQIAKNVLLDWLEEVRMYYDEHEKILEAANSIVVRETLLPTNGIYQVPYKVSNEDTNAYILSASFKASGCIDELLGVRLRANNSNNRYKKSSNWEVFYRLEGNTIAPIKPNSSTNIISCDVLFLKFPNIVSLDGNGNSLVNSNLPSTVNNALVKRMVATYLEMTESVRIQTFN